MDYTEVFIKTESNEIIHVDTAITLFYDKYIKGEVEILGIQDGWITNMANEISIKHKVKKFRFCKKNGSVIRDTIYC